MALDFYNMKFLEGLYKLITIDSDNVRWSDGLETINIET